MKIKIKFPGRLTAIIVEIPNDITIEELKREYIKRNIRMFNYGRLFYYERLLDDNDRISTYGIKDGDIISVGRPMQRKKMMTYCDNRSTHVCPYGCGRQIPDGYKGCSELLQAEPNYFG